ncbi:RnfABCDGE type electron transport complex subunit B [Lentisphaerota bacterium ZTH]|nr:RnfABCDGE type electron transport complex subunit B [Lentisphaerota bacterium]WET05178.1 RnfABCDGE type electron transport complex subunit B [Lentisphaerota bacterium ZTH]
MEEYGIYIAAFAAMAIIGAVLGCIIGIAVKIFKVEVDPRIELVTELLPGANCGGCGKAGCADFAKSVVDGENAPNKCPVASQEQVAAIAQALGVELGESMKKVAVVFCGGDKNQEKVQTLYNGVSDCISASLIAGGPKGCAYGCLGMSSCARACPFGAIEIINGLAVVHPNLCVGCGKCVDTCPRDLIKLVPVDAKVHIYCSSPEKGAVKMKVCSVPCIACRKCVKAAEEGQFDVKGFLVGVNYDAEKLPEADIVEKAKCPTGCLLTADKHVKIEESEKKDKGEAA